MKADNKRKLSGSKKEVVSYLAEKGEANMYRISKDLDSHYSTIHASVKALEKEYLIKNIRTEPSMKGGKDKEIYALTLNGLSLYFRDLLNSKKPLDKDVMEKWVNVLPILKKLPLFKKHGLGQRFKEKILVGAAGYYVNISQEETATTIHRHPSDFNHHIEQNIIGSFSHMVDADLMVKWYRILDEDKELRCRTKIFLKERRDSYKAYLSGIEGRLEQVFPLLENAKPDWDKIREIEKKL